MESIVWHVPSRLVKVYLAARQEVTVVATEDLRSGAPLVLSGIISSAKSAKYRSKQGPMKSVFKDDAGDHDDDTIDGKGKLKGAVSVYPAEFETTARQFVQVVREELTL